MALPISTSTIGARRRDVIQYRLPTALVSGTLMPFCIDRLSMTRLPLVSKNWKLITQHSATQIAIVKMGCSVASIQEEARKRGVPIETLFQGASLTNLFRNSLCFRPLVDPLLRMSRMHFDFTSFITPYENLRRLRLRLFFDGNSPPPDVLTTSSRVHFDEFISRLPVSLTPSLFTAEKNRKAALDHLLTTSQNVANYLNITAGCNYFTPVFFYTLQGESDNLRTCLEVGASPFWSKCVFIYSSADTMTQVDTNPLECALSQLPYGPYRSNIDKIVQSLLVLLDYPVALRLTVDKCQELKTKALKMFPSDNKEYHALQPFITKLDQVTAYFAESRIY